jgi:hypothetical protein
MTLKEWNAKQIAEALSSDNRYFYWLATGKSGDTATDTELIIFYINNGGASGFRERNKQ